MFKIFALLVFLSLGYFSCNASCPNPTVVPNLNLTRYLGEWYEIAVSPSVRDTFEFDCYCTTPIYSIEQNSPLVVKVNNTCRRGSIQSHPSTAIGKAILPNSNVTAKLSVTFNNADYAPYWIIDIGSDYQWALIYSCTSLFLFDFEGVWLIARDPLFAQHNPQQTKTILQTLNQKTGYDISRLHYTDQSGCVYKK
eukprot:TRINITY_DN3170_c1_g1_i2.p1 TRINITY_DN3170_c1_g1~~TRINITY_DN3170_c1_g1_i2.p1  ORF type:complete len:195 (-),score=33.04 TRINITY_DN3170_c1_g1_i2:39-623(-)